MKKKKWSVYSKFIKIYLVIFDKYNYKYKWTVRNATFAITPSPAVPKCINAVTLYARPAQINSNCVILVKLSLINRNQPWITLWWRCWHKKNRLRILINWSKFVLSGRAHQGKPLWSVDSKDKPSSNTQLLLLAMTSPSKIEWLTAWTSDFSCGTVPVNKDTERYLLCTIKVHNVSR